MIDEGGADIALDDDAFEFRQFCESSELLRQHSGNSSVVTAVCLERSDFDNNDLIQLLSIVIILGVGAFVREVLGRLPLKIPYTVAIFFVGLGVGRLSDEICPILDDFVAIVQLKPQLILSTFLPVLIFESAMEINIHTFRRTLPQILLLAGPGLLFSTFITAVVSIFLFIEYEWNFVEASLFGSIISATDPVAVVGLLRDLGAAESLSVLIEGESLLNDGIAVLLFKIFEELLVHNDHEGGWGTVVLSGFLKFLLIGVGGPVFGFVCAKITIFCLSKVFNDPSVEVSITLASAYLTFYVGEEVLGVSGILAVVLLGLTLKANHCISPQSEVPLHHFWEVIGYMANTLLFFLIGLIIGRKAFLFLDGMDFPYLFALYASVILIRFLMLVLLKPILHKFGYGFDWKTLSVVSWGGLRGAVGLCLALEVYEEPHLCTIDKLGPKVLFQTAGIVILTLLLNATTTKKLMQVLNMTTISQRHRADMEDNLQYLEITRRKYFRGLRHHPDYANADWNSVRKFTFIESELYPVDKKETEKNPSMKREINTIEDTMKKASAIKVDFSVKEEPENGAEFRNQLNEDDRLRLLKAFKISFRRQYEQGVIQGSVLKYVLEVCNRIEDTPSKLPTCTDVMNRWSLEKRNGKTVPCGRILKFSRIFAYFVQESEKEKVHLSLQVGKGFVSAIEQVVNLIPKMFHDFKDMEKVRFMKRILEREKFATILQLGSLQMSYQKIAVAAKSRYAARLVINQMQATLLDLRHDGLIERDDADILMLSLEHLIKKLHKFPKIIGVSSPETFLANLSWFRRMLQPKSFEFLQSKAVLLNFLPGDTIYKIGDLPHGVYLIITGLAKVGFIASERLKMARMRYGMFPICEILEELEFKDSFSDIIGPGGIVGELGFLKKECRSSSVTCETFLTAYFFPSDALDQVAQASLMSFPGDDLLLHLWASWGFKVACSLCQYLPQFQIYINCIELEHGKN
ncbi:sodium/hydrogen exchanger 8 isoform X2 [Folsomia candida]|uniref:sodium/hydrogen exchanger 8 isoform X2 n=1 Tax=Folsomia candida TaxID=158441 RepID=UPI001604BA92|nr:sodium/hydrogen exchanger 8 isoform X2 [Folsomia candida]